LRVQKTISNLVVHILAYMLWFWYTYSAGMSGGVWVGLFEGFVRRMLADMGNVFFLSKVTLRMLKNVRLPRRSAPRNDKE